MHATRTRISNILLCLAAVVAVRFGGFAPDAAGSDWPMWGHDAARSGASPAALDLPETLHLHWVRELPAPRRAWAPQFDDGDKLEFDLSYAPIVYGGRLFVASMTTDSLTAYAADTGEELWRFYADGPMRLAPAAGNGRVYAGSDDGRFYSLDAATGEVAWTFDTAPSAHRVLGNERIVSMWSVRGGPVLADGTVYFASGVWPFLGTFVYALDAETGAVQWANTGHATEWQAQPHGGAYSFAGLAPQGYLAVSDDRIVVSGGRSFPALFDRSDGRLLHSQVRGAKGEGGYRVRVQGDHYINHGRRYRLRDGASAGSGPVEHEAIDALRERTESVRDRLDGEVFESLVAGGRLYVSTRNGRLYCFGPNPAPPRVHRLERQAPSSQSETAQRQAEVLLRQNRTGGGYLLFLGVGDGDLIEQVALQGDVHVVGIDPDRARIDALRRRFDRAGLYGTRIALLVDDPADAAFPPHISSMVLMEDPAVLGGAPDRALVERVYAWLRPYTGTALLRTGMEDAALAEALDGFTPENGRIAAERGVVLLAREGPLPEAGEWTHQYADAAQSVLSRDLRVRPPFGPIWYGGPSHDNVLPRHAAGPRPQVAGGRLVILGVESLGGRCVFTGRELWVREFPGIGHAFTNLELEERWSRGESVYMTNQPGATYIGSPYVTLADAVYLRYRGRVIRLDPDTGGTVAEWALPARPGEPEGPDWGHISVSGDRIVTTTNPHIFRGGALGTFGDDSWDGSSSERIVVLDRHTGETLWVRDAGIGFRHNAIASANGRLFVNDLLSEQALQMARRRGLEVVDGPRLSALDIDTGAELWTVGSEVFGTFLSYSAEHDILIEGGTRDGRRHVRDEPTDRMVARRGATGEILWTREGSYSGPVILRDDMIIPARPGSAICLLTGGNRQRIHPVTGEETVWSYWKTYGCGTANASPHLLLFRSGAAGFTDLESGSTGTLGGFRAGCTANMIAADGVLNAPDYTRSCTCSYQNQTSLGMIHMPEMEMWTINRPFARVDGAIERVGLNLGAPGDRLADNGTLWVHVPQRAPSPEIDVLVLGSADPADVPARILAARGSSAADSRPEYTLDGDDSTGWSTNCRRRGRFNDTLLYELDRAVEVSRIEAAWTGPVDTEYVVEVSEDGEDWTAVAEGKGRGPGRDGETYAFDPVRARQVRLRFGEHGDTREDSRGRRLIQSLTVHQVRIGDLPYPDAYAHFTPKSFFRRHSLLVDGRGGLNWVSASGLGDIGALRVRHVNGGGRVFALTLHFAEPGEARPGERRFDIRAGDRLLAQAFDPAAAADGANRAVTVTFDDVPVDDDLVLTFTPSPGSVHPPILCGVELVRRDAVPVQRTATAR